MLISFRLPDPPGGSKVSSIDGIKAKHCYPEVRSNRQLALNIFDDELEDTEVHPNVLGPVEVHLKPKVQDRDRTVTIKTQVLTLRPRGHEYP